MSVRFAALLPRHPAAPGRCRAVEGARREPAKQTFVFNDPNHRDTVTFMLDAPLEVINGLSNQVKGSVTVEGTKASGKLAVPVSSIKTGNETRDGHLQNDKWLDAAKYPDIIVEFKDLALPGPLEPGKPVKLKTQGKFTIHGVTREEPVEVTAFYLKESERHEASALRAICCACAPSSRSIWRPTRSTGRAR